jgi:putative MATE family efflux protein
VDSITNTHKRNFYRRLSRLALPIVLQNLISAAVNSVDVLMLGYVSENALSAVSLANQLMFLLQGFFFGICSVDAMLVSQYWGKGDRKSIQAVMGIAFKLSFLVTALAAAAALFFPHLVMGIFTKDADLITLGSRYLRTIGISYLLMSISQVYEYTMRSMERAKLTTVLASTALLLNIFLNAVFIFGLFGAPKLGVVGVAIATVIARTVEVLLCLVDAIRSKTLDYSPKVLLGSHPALMKDFIRYAVPALLNDMSWTVAFSTYSIIFGHLGSDVVAANAVAATVRNLATTVCYGLASAGTVLIGKSIGDNRMEEAKRDASTLCHMTLIVGAITGGLILLARPLVFHVYNTLTPTGQDYLGFMLLVSSYYVIGQGINTLVIAGIFRAGGDSRFGMICDTVDMWCIAVPISFFCAFVLKLPVKWVYFIICLDEFYKIPVVYHHYKKYGWLKNITRDYE